MYAKHNVKLGWFEIQQNFVVCEPKLTNFSVFDVELIIVIKMPFSVYRYLYPFSRYTRSKSISSPKMRELSMLGRSK